MAGQNKNTEKPLSAEELKFCTLYVRFRDIYKAADRAKIKRGNAVRTFNKLTVQDEIERQMEALRSERAKVTVEEEQLDNKLLDLELINLLRGKETSDSLKLEAIRLGYVAIGKIQAGSTRVLDQTPAQASAMQGDDRSPGFYKAFVQIQREQDAAPIVPVAPSPADVPPPAPAPPVASAPPVSPTPPTVNKTAKPGSIRIG